METRASPLSSARAAWNPRPAPWSSRVAGYPSPGRCPSDPAPKIRQGPEGCERSRESRGCRAGNSRRPARTPRHLWPSGGCETYTTDAETATSASRSWFLAIVGGRGPGLLPVQLPDYGSICIHSKYIHVYSESGKRTPELTGRGGSGHEKDHCGRCRTAHRIPCPRPGGAAKRLPGGVDHRRGRGRGRRRAHGDPPSDRGHRAERTASRDRQAQLHRPLRRGPDRQRAGRHTRGNRS